MPVVAGAPPGLAATKPALAAAARHGAPQLAVLRERALQPTGELTGSLTGAVAGPGGAPQAGVCVSAIGVSRSITRGTNPAGRFDITGLAPGSYALEYRDCADPARYAARWSGGTASQQAATRVQVKASHVTSVPAVTLRAAAHGLLGPDPAAFQRMLANDSRPLSAAAAAKTGRITGVVTGYGRPLAGICVEADPTGNGIYYVARTRTNGTYTLRGMIPRRYTVTFEPLETCRDTANWLQQNFRGHNTTFPTPAQILKVTRGKTIRGVDAGLIQGGQIAGRVTSKSGKPLRGMCVDVDSELTPTEFQGYGAGTNKHGRYVMHALYPGRYFEFQFQNGCNSFANYTPVYPRLTLRIRRGSHRTVNASMPVGAIIAGTVRLGSKTGKRLQGICVQADSFSAADIESFAVTSSTGHYRMNALGTGRYLVSFMPGPGDGCNNDGDYLPVSVVAHAKEGRVTRGVNAVMQVGASISGTVTDSSGHGLGGMCIDLTGPGNPNVPAATSSNGTYVINEMAAGTYQLGFTTGCGNNGNYAPWYYDNQSDQGLANPVHVGAGSSQTINAVMRTGGAISGTVTGRRGRVLTGICVGAVTPADAETGSFTQSAYSRRGRFAITGLEPGKYYVDFSCAASARYADQWFPDAPDSGTAHLVTVAAGQTSGISAVLRSAGSISGVVTGPQGKRLNSVCVEVVSARNGASVGSLFGYPTAHGAYRVTGLPAGRYDVEFTSCGNSRYATQWYRGRAAESAATPVAVRVGKTTRHINARLTVGGTIAGRVSGTSGEPLNNMCVFAYNSGGQFAFAFTGRSGTYTMTGVSSGRYTVEIEPCNDQNLVTVFRTAKVVAAGATTRVNATLHEGGSVSGRVTAATTPAGPAAYECAEVDSANPGNAGGIGFSGPNGNYTATGIAAGTYTVYIGDPQCGGAAPDLVPQWFDNQASQAKATTITVTVGHTTTGVDAALQTAGEITGAVSKPSGAPLSGACVTAYPAASSPPLVAVSGRSGTYSLIDVQPGRYRIEFSAGCGASGYRTQWWATATSKEKAAVIHIAAAQSVTGVDATLSRKHQAGPR